MNSRARLRAVFLDVDGTMFETLPSLTAAVADVLEQSGMRAVPSAALKPALNHGLRQMFRRALVSQPMPVDPDGWFDLECRFLDHYANRRLLEAKPYPGVCHALVDFKARGLKLGICTNRDRASATQLLEAAAVCDLFDVVIGLVGCND